MKVHNDNGNSGNNGRETKPSVTGSNSNGTQPAAPENTSGSGDSRQGKISLPVGGGAIRGMGEKFQANPATGTASFSVPLTISPGRGEFTPKLALSYDSGSGNSAFGLGWSVGLPSITRKTDKGLPQYNDHTDHESDVFILSGAEDLVPLFENGQRSHREEGNYAIYAYRPRTEGLFALIERWTDTTTGISHWRTVSKENIVSVFGFSEQARIADPAHPHKIFSWLLEESRDAKGNLMQFIYKQENGENVPDFCYENPRKQRNTFVNRYLKEVAYGNQTMSGSSSAGLSNYTGGFHFRLVFDYGEHANNQLIPDQTWLARADAFSNYRSGFEIRTYRLCQRILMFHEFEELGATPVLVRSTDLDYDTQSAFSLLQIVTQRGYQDGNTDCLPYLKFSYTQAQPAPCFQKAPEEILKQLPAGVDGQNYQWADLYSEGVSGILTMSNEAWYFKPNYGDAQFTNPQAEHTPVFGNMKSEIPKPSAANTGRTSFRLSDVNSDGFPELVIQGEGINGFYTRDEEGNWQNFRNFADNPNIDMGDANLRFLDLSGDGLADIVISKGETFDIYFSEGKKGFPQYRRVRCGTEPGNAPQLLFSDPKQTVFLADMSGDGLTDIVKITSQSIAYFPNMGYGRFGEKVVMSNPPLLDSPDRFDARYVHLTDADGTGTADLLYISEGKIRYFKNLSGNGWEEQKLPATLLVNATLQTFIQTTDLFGNGTQCLVVSSSLPQESKKMRYWELTSGIKPFLLSDIDNNMGGVTRLHYAPSTKFYMQDKLKGTPWITKLPFPVQVLEKVETIDLVGNKRFTNRYAYHHGYYDTVEREFRGFGMVEQWDSENYESRITNHELDVPPVYTKTWFHTGFYARREKISRQYENEYFSGDTQAWQLPDTVLPENLSGEATREASRALRGSPLRIEIYAQDGTDKEAIPYTVEEKSYHIQCLQPQCNNKHAIFLKTESESLLYHYERNTGTPRVVHKLVLETDEYGNPVKQAQIAYPRRGNAPFAEQEKALVIYSENSFINAADIAFRLIGVNYQTRQYEIHNMSFTGNKFDAESLKTMLASCAEIDYADTHAATNLQKRLIQHTKTLFWNKTCSQALPLGEIAPQALPCRQQSLELTQELINRYNSEGIKLTAALLANDCRYLQTGQNWFAQSETEHFSPIGFYLPDTVTDPFNNITTLEYDLYNLFLVKVTDAQGFKTTAKYDYRVLQANRLTDSNENYQCVAFDLLGKVIKLAVTGKNNEGDTLADPTEEYQYDLHCWANEQKPVYAHVKKRETHGNTNIRWLESYVYTDGLGNEIMTKSCAADGSAWTAESITNYESGITDKLAPIPTDHRWLASGKVIYNNKGLAVKQYEPWFSDNPDYEFDDRLAQYGVTPILHYDPLGRLIQTDFPDGTTTKVEFDVWQQKNYDPNDCDIHSSHCNTPQVIDLDVLGRPFQTTDNNGSYGLVKTHNQLDSTGRIIKVTDALNRTATQNMYALSEKHLLRVNNIDSGTRWLLNNTAGKPVRRWDERGHEFTFCYDELQRPTDTLVNGMCVERTVYGIDALQNNIGQIAENYAQDGIASFEYDFKGNVIRQTKQFAQEYQNEPDWNTNPALINEFFVTETAYDALNRPTDIVQPDGTTLHYGYDKGGLLTAVLRNNTELHISGIEYNEKGQRLNIYYGNNTKTSYEYNPLNFRLTRLLTTRNNGQDILQYLNYEFDAVGNITKQTDNAQQTFYFNNSVIAPTSTYEYDALYRLLKATGRELNSLTAPTHNDFVNNIPCPNTAANAMQNYVHNYQYDALGNILQDAWKNYQYATANNYLLGNNNVANQYTYDAHGNMLSMPHLNSLSWDYQDQLHSAGNGTFTSYYNYDAQGNRTRKVVEKGNIREERYYIGSYEIYRKEVNGSLDTERTTLNISDDEKVFVHVEQKTRESEAVRYQYDNHLGSACLELNNTGQIISYEEYHPFGTTSYRSGRSEIEVSLKRYKYCGKERDEETGLYYYGMRYYAVWICRFVSVDPLQFKYPYYTPYQYAGNKPITFIDLDGAEPAVGIEKHEHTTGFGPNKVGTMENPINLQEVIVLPSDGLLITSFGTAGAGEDFTFGTGTIPQNINVERQSRWSNEKLFDELEDALTDGTFGEQDDEVAPLVQHFRNNTGEMYIWSNSTTELIEKNTEYNEITQQIRNKFVTQMESNKGNFSAVDLNGLIRGLPAFSALNGDVSLNTLIGGVQQLTISLTSITFGEDNTYSATLNISIYDDFGVEETDISKASFAAQFGMEGLKSLWVLQHQRGFKPFTTKANFNTTIKNEKY